MCTFQPFQLPISAPSSRTAYFHPLIARSPISSPIFNFNQLGLKSNIHQFSVARFHPLLNEIGGGRESQICPQKCLKSHRIFFMPASGRLEVGTPANFKRRGGEPELLSSVGTCSHLQSEPARIGGMSNSEDDRSFSAEYEALAMAEAEEKAKPRWGLSRDVLETMTNYSSSSSVGSLTGIVDLWELYGITPPASRHASPPASRRTSPPPPPPISHSFLLNEISMFQQQNRALLAELFDSERTNAELANLVSHISSARVMACLERDQLRRFKVVSIIVMFVFMFIVLIGIVFILG